MSNIEVLEWTFKLQYELDNMSNKELNKFLKTKAIRYDGQIWGKNEQGKNSKVKRKTSGIIKGSDKHSEGLRENEN